MAEYIRFVDDLAMHAFSRGKETCVYCTTWCKKNCYFNKFYAMGWANIEWDKRDNQWWKSCTVDEFVEQAVVKIPFNPSRFRFSVKGEIWTCVDDVSKVRGICDRMPDTTFWIPTRAWQDSEMEAAIEDYGLLELPNARVMASVDPSVGNQDTLDYLHDCGWSILYVGHNEHQDQMVLGEEGLEEGLTKGMYRCPKTWEEKLGHCAICAEGCFSEKRVDVQLRKHK